MNHLIAVSVPDGGAKRGVMSKSIDIVLRRASDGHGKDAFTDELIDLVANAIGSPWILDSSGNRIGQSESMIGFAEQDNPGVGGQPLIGSLNLDRTIEFRLKKVTLSFTNRVILLCV